MTRVWIIGAALALNACNGANERICETPPSTPAVGDWQGCVHRWSYRLASAPGTSAQIAEAVAVACEDAVRAAYEHLDTSKYPDLLYSDLLEEAERKALFRVTQARAGHCAIM